MTDDLLAGGLPGTQGTMSDSGWSNSKILQTYLTEHFLKYVPTHKDDPLLLLYDGHSSHVNVPLIDWAEIHNVILFLLPAHKRYLTQPLDVGVFGPFKMNYYKECRNFLKRNPGRVVTRYDICKLTANAFSHTMSVGHITGSFRRAGIYPFDADVVNDEQLAPSRVVNMQHVEAEIAESVENGDQQLAQNSVVEMQPTDNITTHQVQQNTLAAFLHSKMPKFVPPYKQTNKRLATVTGGEAISEGKGKQQLMQHRQTTSQTATKATTKQTKQSSTKVTQKQNKPLQTQPRKQKHASTMQSNKSNEAMQNNEVCCVCHQQCPPGGNSVLLQWTQCSRRLAPVQSLGAPYLVHQCF